LTNRYKGGSKQYAAKDIITNAKFRKHVPTWRYPPIRPFIEIATADIPSSFRFFSVPSITQNFLIMATALPIKTLSKRNLDRVAFKRK
jgi:hypothetical protein